MRTLLGSILTLALTVPIAGQVPLYLDPSQPVDRRVDDLIPRLTLEEKAARLCTTAPAIERLKIPVMNGWNQSLHGVVWTKPTTMFRRSRRLKSCGINLRFIESSDSDGCLDPGYAIDLTQ